MNAFPGYLIIEAASKLTGLFIYHSPLHPDFSPHCQSSSASVALFLCLCKKTIDSICANNKTKLWQGKWFQVSCFFWVAD